MKHMKIVITLWMMAIWQVGLSANILIHKMLQNDKIGKLNSKLGEINNSKYYIETVQKTDCDCGLGGSCSFNEVGIKVCSCRDGYAEKDGFCQECKCTDKFEPVDCEFVNDKKECKCPFFEAQKDDRCIDCYCGDNGNCSFVGDEKKCFCLEGFVDRSGYCEECNCGPNGKCSLFYGLKECECEIGYGNKHGFCSACDCGQNVSCTFTLRWNSYEKSCICPEGYQEVNNRCEESTTAVGTMSTVRATFPETTENLQGSTETSTSDPDECDPGKCLHGTCELIGKRNICKCDKDFIGKHCDVRREEIPEYNYLWIVYVALFNVSLIFLITSACLYCKSK